MVMQPASQVLVVDIAWQSVLYGLHAYSTKTEEHNPKGCNTEERNTEERNTEGCNTEERNTEERNTEEHNTERRNPEGEGCLSHTACDCHAICVMYRKGGVHVHCYVATDNVSCQRES